MDSFNKVAARWWADKIRDAVSSEIASSFEEQLAKLIEETVEKNGAMYIGVNDLQPDLTLRELASKCGFSAGAFPARSAMAINKDRVVAKVGFGTVRETIFEATT